MSFSAIDQFQWTRNVWRKIHQKIPYKRGLHKGNLILFDPFSTWQFLDYLEISNVSWHFLSSGLNISTINTTTIIPTAIQSLLYSGNLIYINPLITISLQGRNYCLFIDENTGLKDHSWNLIMATELKRKSRDLSMDLPGSKAHSLWSIS